MSVFYIFCFRFSLAPRLLLGALSLFALLFRISRKTSNIFFKIISLQSVKRSKFGGYSMFPAVNSSKRRNTAVGREFTAVDESKPIG